MSKFGEGPQGRETYMGIRFDRDRGSETPVTEGSRIVAAVFKGLGFRV